MKIFRAVPSLFLAGVLATAFAEAQGALRETIPNWPAPPFWSPSGGLRTAPDGEAHRLQAEVGYTGAFPFIPFAPCRQYDSRSSAPLIDNTNRTINLTGSPCGIPAAAAVSVNITVFNITGATGNGVFRVGIAADPPTAWINYPPAETQRANAGIVPTDSAGNVVISVNQGGGSLDLTVDVNGYYGSPSGDSTNVFVGRNAGNTTMSGLANTGIGNSALFLNNTGNYNTAIGNEALSNDVHGSFNTGIGSGVLFSNDGDENTALGVNALAANTYGSSNTAIGGNALFRNISGTGNTAIGASALLLNTTGSFNIAIGIDAGGSDGDHNIYIGSSGGGGESDTIRIGMARTRAFIGGIFGATTVSGVPVLVDGNGQLGTMTSSRRFKEDIREIAAQSDGLMRLRPVSFRYKPELDPAGLEQYGLVAEEVAEVYPDLVTCDAEGQPQAVRYHFLVPMLLNEVQKDRKTIEEQRLRVQKLETRLERLEALLSVSAR